MFTPKKSKDRIVSFLVKEENTLFDFAFKKMGSLSKTALKNYLAKGQISVNNKAITQYDYQLKVGDTVKIDFTKGTAGLKCAKISVIYEDDYIIVINKAEGLLSVATDKNEKDTAFRIIMNHLKKQNKNNRLYIVHRLDRETSGLLLFAKQKETQMILQENWQRIVSEKKYYALVEGILEQKEGTVHTWLNEDVKSKKVYSSDFDNGGQESFTDYKVEKEYKKGYSLLSINLRTGRKNQIRVHMQCIGHPIAGDKKYGGSPSPIGRIGLHAEKLTLRHPITGQVMTFVAPLPEKIAKFR
ncbi:MAG: RluA family pseudouridine synthase [Paludibacteraceae bacterium]|nr:RluA family pseudouridine synthase [Paludibacteraceae bacterium]MBO7636273.1 RluA family pseudouridine synthase [Paludibacteraceae bacterium]